MGPIPVNGGRCFGRPRQHLGSLGDAFWNLFEQIKGLFGLLMGFGFWVENGGILQVSGMPNWRGAEDDEGDEGDK